MPLFAPQVVQVALEVLVGDVWRVPEKLRPKLVRALRTSPVTRAVQLRQHLALVGAPMDLEHFFVEVCTPAFAVGLIDDVRAVGCLTQAEAAQAQEGILARVTREGQWETFNHSLKERID